ncbi:MAG: hypothetical protein M3Y54_07295 [Bacteroidota bacterium]|nr:hypothetical protein [Bacteroidota bacterium]
MAAGTQITFTDNGWQAAGGFRATEGTAVYTAPAGGVPRGLIITFSTGNHPDFTATGTFLLATEGDQILAYQGSSASPRFIYGLTMLKTWNDAVSSNTSALPPGLQPGVSALALPWVNAYMNRDLLRRGLTATVRTGFTSPDYWTGDKDKRVAWPLTDLILEGVVPDADELQALQALYTGNGGASWTNHTNWPTTALWSSALSNIDFAQWFGVSTSAGDINTLDLSSNQLTGTIPATLSKLKQLTSLTLKNNQLTGTIPAELAQLPQLRNLRLNLNQLSGYVPQELAQLQLSTFNLANNKLSSVPDFSRNSSGNLSQLAVDVAGNAISFGPLEANFSSAGVKMPMSYSWANQLLPTGEDTETQTTAEPLVLTCSISGAKNQYQWGKYTGTGTSRSWNAIPGAMGAIYRVNSPARSDAGSYACKVTNTWVTNLELWSRTTNVVINAATGPAPPQALPADDFDRNWTIERTYDAEGNVASNILSESKQFTDGLGRATQTQARSRANPHVFASETIYDSQGRPVVQTLAAPINNQNFAYKEKFAAISPPTSGAIDAVEFGPDNFEEDMIALPAAIDVRTPGTLGYYYSTDNELEPMTPATNYPYSITAPAGGPLGGLKWSAGPGEAFRRGSGHEGKGREIPLLSEFNDYVGLRRYYVPGSNNENNLHNQGSKSISVDADGREAVVVSNKEGQALISCLTGTQYPARAVQGFISTNPANQYDGQAPRFVDIHIPATGEHKLAFTVGGVVRIINLNGETGVSLTPGGTLLDSTDVVVPSGANNNNTASIAVYLQPGFYRLISRPATTAAGQTQWFTYDAEYGNFSYSFYDDAGRAVATVAPNGLAGANTLRNAGFEQEATPSQPGGWNYQGSTGAGYTEGGQTPHGGSLYGCHWQGVSPTGAQSYNAYTFQIVANLPNGKYTLQAWVRSTGGQNVACLVAEEYGTGAPQLRQNINDPNQQEWYGWRLVKLTDILVSNGQCKVGFYSDSPQGKWFIFDDVVLARQTDEDAPAFVTRNTYDSSGRLLASESNDEGRSEYVYARDGRIRFSQSALQRPLGRFSYSNYDELGRVVESGEYTPVAGQGVVFQSQLPQRQKWEAEDQTYNQSDVSNYYTGASGSYVQNMTVSPSQSSNGVGSNVQFLLTGLPTTATYAINLRYSAGFNSTRTMSVYVNNTKVQQAYFLPTFSWSSWDIVSLALPLNQGANVIKVQYDATDNGAINLDYLEMVSEQNPTSTSVLNILEERAPTNSLSTAQCRQRSQIWYDDVFDTNAIAPNTPAAALTGRRQEFTAGAVTKTRNDNVTTWYSYDEQDRVTWTVQDIAGVGVKTLDYKYDTGGNVLEIAYQQGQSDAFHHYYEYDLAQRLYKVYTSPDGTSRTLQAKYFYYLHGPIKRVEVANQLQGVDYTYTLQGWLKSINHVNNRLDPGADSPTNNGIAKDLFGLTLDYFSGDYQSRAQAAVNLAGASTPASPFRYDGTIRTASWRAGAAPAHQSVYDYDAKSQLSQSNFGALTIAGPSTASTYQVTPSLAYKEGGLSYDANGNMQSLRRTDKTGAVTDNFSYEYAAGSNRLSAVHGGGSPSGTTIMDYDYDAVGQMTRQRDEQGQRYYTYDVTGKTTGVYLDAARSQAVVEFAYDDRGFRVSKKSYGTGSSAGQTSTIYYVRDAGGNLLSLYEQSPQTGGRLQRSEVPLYGTSRLGVLTHLDNGTANGIDDARYELNDHLGDARVVFHRPTTEVTTASCELTLAASQEDGQWTGLALARRNSSVAHQGVTTPSNYVAYARPGGGTTAVVSRTVPVLKGDTLTFSAWTYLRSIGIIAGGGGAAARLHVVPVPSMAPTTGRTPDGFPAANRPGLLSRLSAGFALVGWGSKPPAVPNQNLISQSNTRVWLRYRVYDESSNLVSEQYQYQNESTLQTWQPLQAAVRVAQAGTVEVAIGSDDNAVDAYFDDLRLEQTGGLIVQEQHQYAYGSPLVGLNYAVGNKIYRYGYQGQFAEKDAETGFESFQLRLYNDRIGRWTSNDPEGQFSSPYVGMGNNPVSGVDSDGGFCGSCPASMLKSGWAAGGTRMILATKGAFISVGTSLAINGAAAGTRSGFVGTINYNKTSVSVNYGKFKGNYDEFGIDHFPMPNARGAGLVLTVSNPGSYSGLTQTAVTDNVENDATHTPNVPFLDNGASPFSKTGINPLYTNKADFARDGRFSDFPRRLRMSEMSLFKPFYWSGETSIVTGSVGNYKPVLTVAWGFKYNPLTRRLTLQTLRVVEPSAAHLQLINKTTK